MGFPSQRKHFPRWAGTRLPLGSDISPFVHSQPSLTDKKGRAMEVVLCQKVGLDDTIAMFGDVRSRRILRYRRLRLDDVMAGMSGDVHFRYALRLWVCQRLGLDDMTRSCCPFQGALTFDTLRHSGWLRFAPGGRPRRCRLFRSPFASRESSDG